MADWKGLANMNDNVKYDGTKMFDVVVTRVFGAPLEQVWRAWSDPEQVMRWWGPTGFTSPLARMDFREGGTSLVCMRSPEGQDLYNTWTYSKIVPMRRIEFVQRFSDEKGNAIEPADAGLPPDIPREVPHVVTFEARGDGRTQMTVTEYGYPSDRIAELSRAGMEQCLDKMATIFAE
jgi:uncharacterized protein YndB with AHSA1/START domain